MWRIALNSRTVGTHFQIKLEASHVVTKQLERVALTCSGLSESLLVAFFRYFAMESSSSRLEQEKRKQAEIRKQIALLQAQLVDTPDINVGFHTPSSPKRKQPEPTLLAPPTPSPSKNATLLGLVHHGSSPSMQKRESWITSQTVTLEVLVRVRPLVQRHGMRFRI